MPSFQKKKQNDKAYKKTIIYHLSIYLSLYLDWAMVSQIWHQKVKQQKKI